MNFIQTFLSEYRNQEFSTIKKNKGIPMVIFMGNVTASAIGKNNPGLAFGTDIFIAAGTAM